MGIARRQWKNRTAGRKSRELLFQEVIWREQFLPAKFAHAFPQPRAMQQVWSCLFLSWQQHGGKQRCRYSGMEQILLAAASFAELCCTWKSRRWVSALLLCCSLMGSALSPHVPGWVWGIQLPFPSWPLKQTHHIPEHCCCGLHEVVFTTRQFKVRGETC